MRAGLLVACIVLLAAGCGGGKGAKTSARSTPSPQASASAMADGSPAASVAPGSTPAPAGASPSVGGSASGGQSGAATTMAPPGLGRFVYKVSGTRQSPTTGQSEPVPDDTRQTREIVERKAVDGGTQVRVRVSNNKEEGSTEARTRWEERRIVLLSTTISTPAGQ